MTWISQQTQFGAVWVLPHAERLDTSELLQNATRETIDRSAQITAHAKREEFLRSRWLMRKAGGLTEEPKSHPDGDIEWPKGSCGSLTHKNGHIALGFQPTSTFASLGIDLEAKAVRAAVAQRIALPEELQLLGTQWTLEEKAAVIFSAKESIFKAVFPLGRKRFWFDGAVLLQADQSENITRLDFRTTEDWGVVGLTAHTIRVYQYPLTLMSTDGPKEYILASCAIKPDATDDLSRRL